MSLVFDWGQIFATCFVEVVQSEIVRDCAPLGAHKGFADGPLSCKEVHVVIHRLSGLREYLGF